MVETATENGLVTLTEEDLKTLLQETREAAIQAVLSVTEGSEPDPEPEPLKVVNLTNAVKVAEQLSDEARGFIKDNDPGAPITYRQRKTVLAMAEKGGIRFEDMTGWTRGQGSAAIEALEYGHGIKVGPLQVLPR